ncbi:MAG: mannitol-1-phosphate 5-dehydrogenase, partial [Candidatus Caldatribacteriaceae bacterium]
MKYGVQFGAGNIGRGFIGHLLWESGFTTIFVEANQELVRLLNERKSYPLRLLDKDGVAHDLLIDRVEALWSDKEEEIGEAIAGAEVVFTAVGVKNLKLIARALAQGVEKRCTGNPQPLNVFLCENLKDAPSFLQAEVEKYLSPEVRNFCREKIGFVGTVV